MKKRMKKITKSKQKHLAKTYKKHLAKTYKKHLAKTYKKHLAKTYKKHKKHLAKTYRKKTYKKHKFFLQKGGMVAAPPAPPAAAAAANDDDDADDYNCPICDESMTGEPFLKTPCNHEFHVRCLEHWLSTSGASKSCPLCRTQLNPANPAAPAVPEATTVEARLNIKRRAFELCEQGNLEMLQTLVRDYPFLVNDHLIQTEGPQTGWTLLHVAAFNGNMGIVNMLITRGYTSNARTPTMQLASDIAKDNGHGQVAALIEEAIAANDARQAEMRNRMMREEQALADGNPAGSLDRAFRNISFNQTMRVSVMLELGIINPNSRVNLSNGDNWTLLHIAGRYGRMLLIQELLSKGASTRARTEPGGETPAQVARRLSWWAFPNAAVFLEAAERVEIDAEAAAAAAARDEAELAIAAATPISMARSDHDDDDL
jgi:hypothetical protein